MFFCTKWEFVYIIEVQICFQQSDSMMQPGPFVKPKITRFQQWSYEMPPFESFVPFCFRQWCKSLQLWSVLTIYLYKYIYIYVHYNMCHMLAFLYPFCCFLCLIFGAAWVFFIRFVLSDFCIISLSEVAPLGDWIHSHLKVVQENPQQKKWSIKSLWSNGWHIFFAQIWKDLES